MGGGPWPSTNFCSHLCGFNINAGGEDFGVGKDGGFLRDQDKLSAGDRRDAVLLKTGGRKRVGKKGLLGLLHLPLGDK